MEIKRIGFRPSIRGPTDGLTGQAQIDAPGDQALAASAAWNRVIAE